MNYETVQQIKKEQIESYIARIPADLIGYAYTLIKQRKKATQTPHNQRKKKIDIVV